MMIQELIGKLLAGERDGTTLWKVAIGEIEYQPITDPAEGISVAALAENILRCGQLQPLLLYRPKKNAANQGRYQLIAGRRRLEAMRILGRTHVSAIVVRCEANEVGMLALSENLLNRQPDYLEVAEQIAHLLNQGWKIEKLAALFSWTTDSLKGLLELLTLPPAELQLLRIAKLRQRDALRLLELPTPTRRAVLEKCCASPEEDATALIEEVIRNPDPRLTQFQKVWVGDVRIFVNTIEKAVDTMRKAGYDTELSRSDDEGCYSFSIRVAKTKGAALPVLQAPEHVSRETSGVRKQTPRFSPAVSIFEALAEDEKNFLEDVSRETSAQCVLRGRENAEKLEICIDESLKK